MTTRALAVAQPFSSTAASTRPVATPAAATLADTAFALLRVMVGVLIAFHGAQKLFGVLGGGVPPMFSQLWLGGVIELAGGALVALGLATRPAAFLLSGTMAVAYLQFHWQGALDARFFPIVNQGELALVYAFVFLYLAVVGAGRFGLDALRRR